MKSISVYLNLVLLIIISLVLSGFGYYDYNSTQQRLFGELESNISLSKDRLTLSLPAPIWNFDTEAAQDILKSEAKANYVKGILVKDTDGEIFTGAIDDSGKITGAQQAPEEYTDIVTQDISIMEGGESVKIGTAHFYISDEYIQVALQQEIEKVSAQIVALNFIIFIMFTLSIRRVTRPLLTLTNAAEDISRGNYESAINIQRKDEIGKLANNFNTMKSRVQKKIQDLAELNTTGQQLASLLDQNKALEVVIKAMHDHANVSLGSVYLFDEDNKLKLQIYYPPKAIDEHKVAKSFEVGEGIIGKAANDKKIIYIPDTSQSTDFVQAETDTAKTLLCVPLMDNDVLLGVMNFFRPSRRSDVRGERLRIRFFSGSRAGHYHQKYSHAPSD